MAVPSPSRPRPGSQSSKGIVERLSPLPHGPGYHCTACAQRQHSWESRVNLHSMTVRKWYEICRSTGYNHDSV